MSHPEGSRVASAAWTQVTCSRCGAATSVPFQPTPGRPVFCRDCFANRPQQGGGGAPASPRAPPRGPPRRDAGPRPGGNTATSRQRMMAQGRKGHFMHDARLAIQSSEGGMEDQHVRAFLEGIFARGARTNVAAAIEFLDSKVADETITPRQRDELARLVERYSFWR